MYCLATEEEALWCVVLRRVEGCLPVCPSHMVLDEITHRCVHTEDCEFPFHHLTATIRLHLYHHMSVSISVTFSLSESLYVCLCQLFGLFAEYIVIIPRAFRSWNLTSQYKLCCWQIYFFCVHHFSKVAKTESALINCWYSYIITWSLLYWKKSISVFNKCLTIHGNTSI